MATEKITLERIIELQKKYGVTSTQKGIDNGQCWHFEGSQGRLAMSCLKSGICILPEQHEYDAYGNYVPSRNDLQDGTQGTLGLAQEFWQTIEDGDDENIDYLHDTFGNNDDDSFCDVFANYDIDDED